MALSVDDLKSKLRHIQAGASTLGENLAKELRKAEARQNVYRRGVRESRKLEQVLHDKSTQNSKQEEGTAAAILDRSQRNAIKSPTKAGTKVSFQQATIASPRTRQLTPRDRRHSPRKHSPRTQQRSAHPTHQVKRTVRKAARKDPIYAAARARQRSSIGDELSSTSDVSVDRSPPSPPARPSDHMVEQEDGLEDTQDVAARVAMVGDVRPATTMAAGQTEVSSNQRESRPSLLVSACASSAHDGDEPLCASSEAANVPGFPKAPPSNTHNAQNASLLSSTRHEVPPPIACNVSVRVSPPSYPVAPSVCLGPQGQPQSGSSTDGVLHSSGSHVAASPYRQPTYVGDPQRAPHDHTVGSVSPSICGRRCNHASPMLPHAAISPRDHVVASASPHAHGPSNAASIPQQSWHHGPNYPGFHERLNAATGSAPRVMRPFAGLSPNEIPHYPENAHATQSYHLVHNGYGASSHSHSVPSTLVAPTYQSSKAVQGGYGAPPHSQPAPGVIAASTYQSSHAVPSDYGMSNLGLNGVHASAPSEAVSARKKFIGNLVAEIRGLLQSRRAKSAEIPLPLSRSSPSSDLQSAIPTSLHELLHRKKADIGTSHARADDKARQRREHRSPSHDGLWSPELGTYELRARLDHAKRELQRSATSATASVVSAERKAPELSGTYSSLPPVTSHGAIPAAMNSRASTPTRRHYLLPSSTHADLSRRHVEPAPRHHHHHIMPPSPPADVTHIHIKPIVTLSNAIADVPPLDDIHHPDLVNELYVPRSNDYSLRSARSDYGRSARSEATRVTRSEGRGDGVDKGLHGPVKDEPESSQRPPTPKMAEALQMLKNEMEALRQQLSTQSHAMREHVVAPPAATCPRPKKTSSPDRSSAGHGHANSVSTHDSVVQDAWHADLHALQDNAATKNTYLRQGTQPQNADAQDVREHWRGDEQDITEQWGDFSPDDPVSLDMAAEECDDSDEVVEIRQKLAALRDEMDQTMNRLADSELGSIKKELSKLSNEVSSTSRVVHSKRLSNASGNPATTIHSGSIVPHHPASVSVTSARSAAMPSGDAAARASSSGLSRDAAVRASSSGPLRLTPATRPNASSYSNRTAPVKYGTSSQRDSHTLHPQQQHSELYDTHPPGRINSHPAALHVVPSQNTSNWTGEHRHSSASSYAAPPVESRGWPPTHVRQQARPSSQPPSSSSRGQQQQCRVPEYTSARSSVKCSDGRLRAVVSPPASTRPHFVRDSVNYYPIADRAVGAEQHRVWGSGVSTISLADGASSTADYGYESADKRVSLVSLGINGAGVRASNLQDGHGSPPVPRVRSPTGAAVAAHALDVLVPPCLKC